MTLTTRRALIGAAVAAPAALALPSLAHAARARNIDRAAEVALNRLYSDQPRLRALDHFAKGVLIFPRIANAGFMVGGRTGEGVLRVDGRPSGYYRITAASFGLQIGVQVFSTAMFLITDGAMHALTRQSDGWAIGAGPTVVVADAGFAASVDTTQLTQDVYASTVGQSGLMAGVSLEGSRISVIHPR